MKKFAKYFLFLIIFAVFATGFLFGGGKKEPKAAPLPEGTPIGGGASSSVSSPNDLSGDQRDLQNVAKVTLTKSEYIFVKQLRVEVDRRSKMQEIPPQVSALDLHRMVLDAMISERLVLQAAERVGISSSNAELEQRIQMVRASAGRPVTDQEFSEGIEKQYGLSYSAFQTYLHEDIIRQKYIEQYIVQAAEKAKAGDSITDSDINNEIQGLKDELAAQAGRPPTDEEFNDVIKKQGMDLVTLRGQIRRQLLVQKYLISIAGGAPAEEEIQTFYNRNKARFIRPDTISFDWIRIPYGASSATKTAARTRAEELARKIGSSSSVFNEESAIVESSSNSGSARYIQLTTEDPRIQQVFGLEFIDKALPLEENAVSGIIEGRQGFFIIKVTRKYRQANLGLEDIYRWGNPATVRDLINSQLMQRALTNGAAVVTNTLAEDLRKEGAVEIHEELLVW
ncbi:SurA N-terminal domain-containing protein [Treponema primitia]|uniref:SurA N-terminal domain-containing protein n=1 Tax=Treponema primitia TaxID=88058 RepID=UPI0002554CE8|nr:SurA N-terminal domain-containing protein [Treponema primitia]